MPLHSCWNGWVTFQYIATFIANFRKSINGTEKSSEKNNSDSEQGINVLET